jgi:hypothetical protein
MRVSRESLEMAFVVFCEENPFNWRGSQVVRQRSAKPLFGGSIPPRASNNF